MIVEFLEGSGTDRQNRKLKDIWLMQHSEIENTHDFIQWVFPLNEPSSAVPGSPVLSVSEIDAIRSSQTAKENLSKSASWYLNFLSKNQHWVTRYDHNHLRITRTLKSLDLLISKKDAVSFKSAIFKILGSRIDLIDTRAMRFWDSV